MTSCLPQIKVLLSVLIFLCGEKFRLYINQPSPGLRLSLRDSAMVSYYHLCATLR
jgi:hypothetical protein